MPFFDIPAEGTLPPDVRQMYARYRKATGRDRDVPVGWQAFATVPWIFEARLQAEKLIHQCRFSPGTKFLAFMLIAHKEQCQVCFVASRKFLDRLGFDEAALDAFCASPADLPLPERDRAFVDLAIRVATDPGGLRLKDFQDTEARGLSKEEILEIIGFAAYVNFQITFTKSQLGWLDER